MSISEKVESFIIYFKNRNQYEKNTWDKFELLCFDILYKRLLNEVKHDKKIYYDLVKFYNEIIHRTSVGMKEKYISDYLTDGIIKSKFLSQTVKNIITEYLDIVINNSYKLELDEKYDKLIIYFHKLMIPLHFRWQMTFKLMEFYGIDFKDQPMTEDIQNFNSYLGQYDVTYDPLDSYEIFNNRMETKIFAYNHSILYQLILFMEGVS